MPKYQVTGYQVTPVWCYVEAEDEADAIDIGEDVLTSGAGIYGDPTWQEDFFVDEEVELG